MNDRVSYAMSQLEQAQKRQKEDQKKFDDAKEALEKSRVWVAKCVQNAGQAAFAQSLGNAEVHVVFKRQVYVFERLEPDEKNPDPYYTFFSTRTVNADPDPEQPV